jgi:hypothetical protein
LTEQRPARFLLNDPGFNLSKGRKLRSQSQAGGPAADYQEIDRVGRVLGARRLWVI